MRPLWSLFLAFLVLVLVGGCGGTDSQAGRDALVIESGDTAALNATGMFRTIHRGGEKQHVGRIDGDIKDSFLASMTAEEDQLVMITGRASGSDQAKVIILSPEAERLCEYRIDGVSPFELPPAYQRSEGETRQQIMSTDRAHTIPLRRSGKRFLLVGAAGLWAPSSMVVLEATSRTELVERAVFWNLGVVGHIHPGDKWLVFTCVNNAEFNPRHRYSRAIAVFDMDEMLSGKRPKGRSPAEDAQPTDPSRQYHLYVRFPPDALVVWSRVAVENDVLVLETASGLTIRVPVAEGELEVMAGDNFRRAFERDDREESVDDFLERLKLTARVWRRGD